MTVRFDPVGVNRRLLVGDTNARACSVSSPFLSSATRLALMPQIVQLPRATDFMTASFAPSYPMLSATTALQAQLDQTRHLRPGIVAALSTYPAHMSAAGAMAAATMGRTHLAMSPALEAIRGQFALTARPMFSDLARLSTGLGAGRVDALTRGFMDLIEHPAEALEDQDADEIVGLLEREDADAQLVALDSMHDVVLDVVDSEPVAELLEHVDLDRLAELEDSDRQALDEDTASGLARLRQRAGLVPKGHVATLVIATTTLTSELLVDPPDALTVEAISPYLTLPLGIVAVHGTLALLSASIRRRQARDEQSGTDSDG